MQTTRTENTIDGTSIFITRVVQNPSVKRVLLTVHGYGEHSGRYQHFPDFFKNDFDAFYFFDLRGHGRSGGLRGDAPSVQTFVEDMDFVIDTIQQDDIFKGHSESVEFFLVGHSFGGLVSILYLLSENAFQFKRAVISAPLLGLKVKVPEYKKALAKALLYVLPRLQIENELNATHLSHDPKIVEKYIEDRLVHNKMTPRLYASLMETLERLKTNTKNLASPSLFLIPMQDQIVDSTAALEFYHALKDERKSIKEFPEMYHEIFNELGKQKVFDTAKEWFQKV